LFEAALKGDRFAWETAIMSIYVRALFGFAGTLNLLVGLALLLWPAGAMAFAGIGPLAASAMPLIYFAGTMIALFGYSYFLIAADPVRFRPLIHIGALGKLLAVASAGLPWIMGQTGPRLASVLAPDVIFALLFLDYLRRTKRKV
jgi:hypothetical protein